MSALAAPPVHSAIGARDVRTWRDASTALVWADNVKKRTNVAHRVCNKTETSGTQRVDQREARRIVSYGCSERVLRVYIYIYIRICTYVCTHIDIYIYVRVYIRSV